LGRAHAGPKPSQALWVPKAPTLCAHIRTLPNGWRALFGRSPDPFRSPAHWSTALTHLAESSRVSPGSGFIWEPLHD
jgi:hypothetical protein